MAKTTVPIPTRVLVLGMAHDDDQGRIDPPQVPGQDGAGEIVAVGEGVNPTRIGHRVWVWEAAWQRKHGTVQELCRVPVSQAVGLPEDGIAPGTRWEDVPDTWTCPDCGVTKDDFEMMPVG